MTKKKSETKKKACSAKAVKKTPAKTSAEKSVGKTAKTIRNAGKSVKKAVKKSKTVPAKENQKPLKPVTASPKTVKSQTLPRPEKDALMLEKFRTLLMKRRAEILQSLRDDHHEIDEESKSIGVGDMVDSAQGTAEFELNFRLAEFGSRELGQIDIALQKMTEGTYGICEICGENISLARIKALPFADKCIKCQQECEKAELF
ncbi:MAG: TraR/DksA family transcriptional regulator [Planctomycetaceae bacterium]|nr:TraR/DksA family transcriptional regulator [Planctomycetaceae bacterium]